MLGNYIIESYFCEVLQQHGKQIGYWQAYETVGLGTNQLKRKLSWNILQPCYCNHWNAILVTPSQMFSGL